MLDLLPGIQLRTMWLSQLPGLRRRPEEGGRRGDCPLLLQERYASKREELTEIDLGGQAPDSFPGLVGGMSGDVLLGSLARRTDLPGGHLSRSIGMSG